MSNYFRELTLNLQLAAAPQLTANSLTEGQDR